MATWQSCRLAELRMKPLGGHLAERLPAAQPTQGWTMEDGVDQVAGGGEVPHGFGDVRLAQCQPVAGRTAVAALPVGGHVILRRAQLADRHELPLLLFERSDAGHSRQAVQEPQNGK